jgi:hypothetical protein
MLNPIRRFTLGRVGWLAARAAVVAAGAVVLLAPPSAMASVAPSITSSFTPGSIPAGGTSTLSFTITNNDSAQGITGVGFTDNLPSGVTVATPSNATGTCGSGTLTAVAGSSSITLSGGTLAASAQCTVSADVTSSTAGSAHNSTGTVSSNEDGTGNSDNETLAVVAPPSIASAFTPSTIGVGDTSALSFTITNPNASQTLNGIAFTDTLPAGLVVDNPNGVSAKCGSSAVLSADPGSSTITLTGGKLAGGANCTVSAAVTSNGPGVLHNSTGSVSSTEGGSGTGDTQTLTVVAPPTVSVTAPTEGQVFAYGQKVFAHYSCQEAANGPGLDGCLGDVSNGAPIDTTTPGANTFEVDAFSDDGQVTSVVIDYTVLPNNHFTIAHVKGHASGTVGFDATLPGPGKLQAVETVSGSGKAFARLSRSVSAAKTLHVLLKPNAAAQQLIKNARKHHKGNKAKKLVLRLVVTYTPTGGAASTLTVPRVVIKL